MGKTGRAEATVRFGVFEVDLRSGELRKAGIRIKLQEQPFKVLTALLEHPGEIVTREELRHRIWPEESFGDFDHAVNIAIAKLRTALGDSAGAPHLIETLHRRGYRFIFPIGTNGPKAQAIPTSIPISAASVAVASESWADITSGNEAAATDAAPATSGRYRWLWMTAVLILVLAFGATFVRIARPLPPPRVLNVTQITRDGLTKTGLQTDGSRLYITETNGAKQVLVQTSVTGGDSSVIPTSFANTAMSDISPDHSRMLVADAVGSETEAQIWVLPLPAGVRRRLGNIVGHSGVWSPGGRQLAFAKGSELYMANADGSNVRKLITFSGFADYIQFSPDGNHLRFTLFGNPQTASIWEVRSDGTDFHRVLPGAHRPPLERVCCGAWSPDGRYYFFTSSNNAGNNIWAVREPAGLSHRRASPPVQLTNGPMSVCCSVPSPDGRTLFVGGTSSRGELVRYDPHSHQFVPFLSGICAGDTDFSRDGKWIAFVSCDGILWRIRVDGSERMQLTSPQVSAVLPRWSPDDTQIAYVDTQLGRLWKIFLISAQGGTPQEMLSENQNEIDPSWSPDGKHLAFGRVPWLRASTEKSAIQILDLNSKQISTVPGSENLFSPRWSPDGQRLAAVSLDGKKLLLFDFKTKKWTDWISEPGAVAYPTWSRDGRYIYYENTATKNPGYHRVRVGQTRSELLIDLKDLHRPPFLGSWIGGTAPDAWSGIAPDGSALFVRDVSTDEIYALEVELP